MTLKSRLNIIAFLSVGTVLVLYAFLLYSTLQVGNQYEQINSVDRFAQTASELNIITEQYLAYGEKRHLETWNDLYSELQEHKSNIENFPDRNVIGNSLSSIKSAFELIKKIQQNPESFADIDDRNRLLDRAQTRIRSDIQLLLSVSYNIAENRRETVRNLQVNQRVRFLIFLIPAVFLIVYLIYSLRKRIINSMKTLLQGTKQIADGDLNTHIEIEGSDEHSILAGEFNDMSDKLRSYVKKEQKIREKAEENLKRWEQLVEQDPNLVMIHINGEIKFINPAGVKMMGADRPEQLIGQSAYDYIDETQVGKAVQRIKQVQEKGEKVSPATYKINTLDGKERYLQIESLPIKYFGENAIQTVGLDITDHIIYEEKLEKSLTEKTVLLKEIHHRVKNNLAVISGMLDLQAMGSKNEDLKNQLRESRLRIQSIALIHELLYESDNFSRLKFNDHVAKLVNTILETVEVDRVNVDYEMENIILNVNQAIPCALIINELITNALKHAFKGQEEGTIKISIKERDGFIRIMVQDDGVGMPENMDIHNTDSLGMRIISILSQQLNASIDFTSDQGTEFSIIFEKTEKKGTGSHHLV